MGDAVAVMVSELAMNAVQYARTQFDVTVEMTGQALRVEVSDSGGGNPEALPFQSAASPRGRGLQIVRQLPDQYGVIPVEGGAGKSVWFRVAIKAGPKSPAR